MQTTIIRTLIQRRSVHVTTVHTHSTLTSLWSVPHHLNPRRCLFPRILIQPLKNIVISLFITRWHPQRLAIQRLVCLRSTIFQSTIITSHLLIWLSPRSRTQKIFRILILLVLESRNNSLHFEFVESTILQWSNIGSQGSYYMRVDVILKAKSFGKRCSIIMRTNHKRSRHVMPKLNNHLNLLILLRRHLLKLRRRERILPGWLVLVL